MKSCSQYSLKYCIYFYLLLDYANQFRLKQEQKSVQRITEIIEYQVGRDRKDHLVKVKGA